MRTGRYWCANDGRQMTGGGRGGGGLERPIKTSAGETYGPPLFPLMSTLSANSMICVSERKDERADEAERQGETRRRRTSSRSHHHLKTTVLAPVTAHHASMATETPPEQSIFQAAWRRRAHLRRGFGSQSSM